MAESTMDHILAELRRSVGEYYPEKRDLKNVRIAGHTPKSDHYIYDVVVDFGDGSERLAAKVYRAKGGVMAQAVARRGLDNLRHIYTIFEERKLTGVPRPIGDFAEMGAVVTEKVVGVPLQSVIMKAALLPGYADQGTLKAAAQKTGEWLRSFHRATADMPGPFNGDSFMQDMEKLCTNCRGEGLHDEAIGTILSGARAIVMRSRKTLPCSAVLNDFTPLNVIVGEDGIGIGDFGRMSVRGTAYFDVAQFLAAVEALEKYPFCNRAITAQVQKEFLEAYGVNAGDEAILRVLKMQALLGLFAQGRSVKDSAMRKRVMWATVMKRFIQQAAHRALSPAA